MKDFTIRDAISIKEVAREWDSLAKLRFHQMNSGKDITFNEIMVPTFHDLISDEGDGSLLDVGCGVGIFTQHIQNYFASSIGVDPSGASLDIARKISDGITEYSNCSIEQFSKNSKRRFDVVTANMVLMDAPNLSAVVEATSRIMKRGGSFIFSITHPCFWPKYYGYEDQPWFSYTREIIIRSPFRISGDDSSTLQSTHIHRPLQMYFDELARAGLVIEKFLEPFPDDFLQRRYSKPWVFPRYAVFKCRRPKVLKADSRTRKF